MHRLLAAFLALLAPGLAAGGAWVRDPGEIYLKASVSYLASRELYDAQAHAQPLLGVGGAYTDGRYSELANALYVEYGLGRATTLVGSSALKVARVTGAGASGGPRLLQTSAGPGDLKLGLRWRIRSAAPFASLQPEVKFPLSNPAGRPAFQPDLGSGAVDFGAGLELGGAVPVGNGYWTGGGGYRLRGGRATDEAFWDLEAGVDAGARLRLRARYDGVDSREAAARGAGGMIPVNSGGQDFQRITPAVAWKMGGALEASLSMRRALSGRGALRDTQWELGIAYQGPASSR